jgi:hypothetical protein
LELSTIGAEHYNRPRTDNAGAWTQKPHPKTIPTNYLSFDLDFIIKLQIAQDFYLLSPLTPLKKNMNVLKFAATAVALAAALAAPSAHAWVAAVANVTVTDQVSVSNTVWHYNYVLENASYCMGSCSDTIGGQPIGTAWLGMREFSVPFFDDAGITNIAAPTGWAYAISATDTFGLGFGAGTLTWSAMSAGDQLATGAARGGFAYDTLFAPGKGPFQAVLRDGASMIGDPAVPLSPKAIAAGIQGGVAPTGVPEPQSLLLVLAGVGLLAASRARRA